MATIQQRKIKMKIASVSAFACGFAWALAPVAASAQADASAYPNRPVRIIVGFTPGSATDVTARLFAQRFSEAWGVSVVVENIPGAGGTAGSARAAKATPDGYTLNYGANGAMAIAPGLYSKLTYDPARDFAPISLLLSMPSIVAVNNDMPVKSLRDLITLAKSQPGKLSYASPGAGTPQHIGVELLKITAGVDIAHVPYKGAVLTDVIGGRVPITLQNAAAILPVVRDGRLRGLAVTSLKRSPNMPEFPTVAESGFPGFEAVSWFGMFAPLGTPAAIVNRLNQEVLKVLSQPDMRTKFTQLGLDTVGSTPGEFAAVVRADVAKWGKVIKDAGISVAD
jgi:tripartite-type tricarboxylate transporter receptor subunit TctC